jgi:hypothetical protein|tara:strand:- start:482 stop:598 length:117 start_codon:yes stop_codon:yes gene_type:complete
MKDKIKKELEVLSLYYRQEIVWCLIGFHIGLLVGWLIG